MNIVFSSTCPYPANHCCSNGKRRTSLGHPTHKCCRVCSAWQKAQLPSTLGPYVQHVWLWPWPHGPPTTEDPRCVSPSEVYTRISSYIWENLLQKYYIDSGRSLLHPLGKSIIFGAYFLIYSNTVKTAKPSKTPPFVLQTFYCAFKWVFPNFFILNLESL